MCTVHCVHTVTVTYLYPWVLDFHYMTLVSFVLDPLGESVTKRIMQTVYNYYDVHCGLWSHSNYYYFSLG